MSHDEQKNQAPRREYKDWPGNLISCTGEYLEIHDMLCDWLEKDGYSERDVNIASVGMWGALKVCSDRWEGALTELQSQCSRLEEENSRLKLRPILGCDQLCVQIQNERDELKAYLAESNRGYEFELHDKQVDIDKLKAEVEKWKDEYNNVCKFANDFEAQRDELKTELEVLHETLDIWKAECKTVVGISVELEKERNELKVENAELTKRGLSWLDKYNEARGEVDKLRADLKTAINCYVRNEKEIAKFEADLDVAVECLNWLKSYIRNYCVFVVPKKNKDGLDTELHMIGRINEALDKIEGNNSLQMAEQIKSWMEKVTKLRADLGVAVKALEFYADESERKWTAWPAPILEDGGRKAREALANLTVQKSPDFETLVNRINGVLKEPLTSEHVQKIKAILEEE